MCAGRWALAVGDDVSVIAFDALLAVLHNTFAKASASA